MAVCSEDCEEYPKDRGDELCLNCGNPWKVHHNWACPGIKSKNIGAKSELALNERFLTKDMPKEVYYNPIPDYDYRAILQEAQRELADLQAKLATQDRNVIPTYEHEIISEDLDMG